jgi:WD40 repeat protein
MAYDAFVSYSHAADGRLAPALQRGLQRLAKPWFRLRALRVFRDESALSANPHLWASIRSALDDSEWFVLLASPDAVASEWVNRELTYWLAHKSADRVLVVLTDGTWEWDGGRLSGTAVPPVWRDACDDEPRHVDLCWAHDDNDVDLRNGRFRDAVAAVAAPIHGIAKDELESEDIRVHRRARRLARSAVVALAVLTVAALVFGVVAVIERGRAEHEVVVADSGRLAAEARRVVDGHVDLALLLAVQARRLDDSVESRGALEATLLQSAQLERLIQIGSNSGAGLSRDGRLLAVDRSDGTIEVLQLPAGNSVARFKVDSAAQVVAFSADGHTLAVAHADGTIELRDVMTGHALGSLQGPAGGYLALAFSPDGASLAGTDSHGGAVVWQLGSSPQPASLFTGTVAIGGPPAWSPDSRTLVTAGLVGGLTFWDARRLVPFGQISTVGVQNGLAFSPDGRMLATGTSDGGIQLLDVASERPLGPPLAGHGSLLAWLSFSPDGQTLVAGDSDGTVSQWDTVTGLPSAQPLLGVGPTTATGRVTTDGQLITLGPSAVAVWHLAASLPSIGRVISQGNGPSGAHFAPDGATLLIGGMLDDQYLRYNVRDDRISATLPRLPGPVSDVEWQPDGSAYVVAGDGGRVEIDDANSGQRRAVFIGLTGTVDKAAFSPDGSLLAAGGTNGTVLVWDVKSQRRVDIQLTLGGVVFGVAFSPDGRTLVADGADGTLVMYDLPTHRVVHTLHLKPVLVNVAFSPDGHTLAVAATGGTFLIDASTGQTIGAPLGVHGSQVSTVAFSRDGSTLAVGNVDGTAIIYEVATRLAIGDPLPSSNGSIGSISITADGQSLAVGHSQGQVVLWDINPASWQQRACATVGRNLTQDEWRQYIGDRPYQKSCPQWPAGP